MTLKPYTLLYKYTINRGKLHVREGVTNKIGDRMVVNFKDSADENLKAANCPRIEDIGVIRSVGPTLWLYDRDDELAKQKFIEFENQKIELLLKQIDKKLRIIKCLEG